MPCKEQGNAFYLFILKTRKIKIKFVLLLKLRKRKKAYIKIKPHKPYFLSTKIRGMRILKYNSFLLSILNVVLFPFFSGLGPWTLTYS